MNTSTLTEYLTDLIVTGVDAEKFLQGQLTCDLRKITLGESGLGAHCNLQGRVVSLFQLQHESNAWRLTMPTSLVDIAEKALRHYARFSKVTFQREQPPREGSVAAWQLAKIETGIPYITDKTSGLFLPHELNLPALGAVSFDKGCYLGQEIVARIEYRGKVKKHLQKITLPIDAALPENVVCAVENENQIMALVVI